MRRVDVFLGSCLAMLALCSMASAGPIQEQQTGQYMGNFQLTMNSLSQSDPSGFGWQLLPGVVGAMYKSGTVSLDPVSGGTEFGITGGWVGNNRENPQYPYGWINFNNTGTANFQLAITFNGAAGINPQVVISGPIKLSVGGGGIASDLGGQFTPTPTKAVLSGWSPASGIPMSLISQYMNLSNYSAFQGYVSGGIAGNVGFSLTFTPSPGPEAPVPEPSSLALYLTLGAALGWRALRTRLGRQTGLGSSRPG